MAGRFFSYSYETGFETFETADEAKASAEGLLEHNREFFLKTNLWDADDSCTIMWGEIRGRAVEKSVKQDGSRFCSLE